MPSTASAPASTGHRSGINGASSSASNALAAASAENSEARNQSFVTTLPSHHHHVDDDFTGATPRSEKRYATASARSPTPEMRDAAPDRRTRRWGAYVIADGRAHYRTVTPGRHSGLSVEIVDGLTAGERVLLHPGQDIVDGTRVSARTTPGR